MKKLRIVLCLIIFTLTFSSCTSADKKVRENLESTLLSLKNNEETAIKEFMNTIAPGENFDEYRALFMEMLKKIDYEILLTEKVKDQDVVACEVKLNTKEIDTLIEDFYKNIINDNIDAILLSNYMSKEDINKNAVKSMTKEYSEKYLVFKNKEANINLDYKKINSKWVMDDKLAFYNALLGDFMDKSETYKNEKLPTLFIESFLDRLKKIDAEQISALSNGEDADKSSAQYELYAKFYNNMDYEIKDTQDLGDGKTKFSIKIDIIDPEKTFKDFGDKYVSYIKNSIDSKKTPTNDELGMMTYKLLMTSIDDNKTNKISKDAELIVDSVLNIENLGDFFKLVLDDVAQNSTNTTKEISERIKNLYS